MRVPIRHTAYEGRELDQALKEEIRESRREKSFPVERGEDDAKEKNNRG